MFRSRWAKGPPRCGAVPSLNGIDVPPEKVNAGKGSDPSANLVSSLMVTTGEEKTPLPRAGPWKVKVTSPDGQSAELEKQS